MPEVNQLDFPIPKAQYLFGYSTEQGKGGDKSRFWQQIMGYNSPESIREAILQKVTPNDLVFQRQDAYGYRYTATIDLLGQLNRTWEILTIWIVLTDENIARFITAVPQRTRRRS